MERHAQWEQEVSASCRGDDTSLCCLWGVLVWASGWGELLVLEVLHFKGNGLHFMKQHSLKDQELCGSSCWMSLLVTWTWQKLLLYNKKYDLASARNTESFKSSNKQLEKVKKCWHGYKGQYAVLLMWGDMESCMAVWEALTTSILNGGIPGNVPRGITSSALQD